MGKVLTLTTLMLSGSATATWAHPGHGFGGTVESIAHWLVSVDHAVTIMALILLAGLTAGVRAASRQVP